VAVQERVAVVPAVSVVALQLLVQGVAVVGALAPALSLRTQPHQSPTPG
jgi:hypothetical protein